MHLRERTILLLPRDIAGMASQRDQVGKMTPTQAEDFLRTLRGRPFTLADAHGRVRMSGSDWSVEQTHLFLLCAPGVQHDKGTDAFQVTKSGGDDELREAILDSVRSFAGRPVPAAQVRARLPSDFVTTDEQILGLARRTDGLEIFGPQLIRIAQ